MIFNYILNLKQNKKVGESLNFLLNYKIFKIKQSDF
jgi:hypothetical protein